MVLDLYTSQTFCFVDIIVEEVLKPKIFSDIPPVPSPVASSPYQNNFVPRVPLFPGLLARLRYPGQLPQQQQPQQQTTTFSTSTITEVSTITTGVTENIVITFLGRPITTDWVRTTTMVGRYYLYLFILSKVILTFNEHFIYITFLY